MAAGNCPYGAQKIGTPHVFQQAPRGAGHDRGGHRLFLVENAAAIKQHTTEIGDAYNNPVIAIEKITQAHTDLIEAMNLADRLKQEGIDSARENLVKLRELSADMEQRSRGLWERAKSAPRSLEA